MLRICLIFLMYPYYLLPSLSCYRTARKLIRGGVSPFVAANSWTAYELVWGGVRGCIVILNHMWTHLSRCITLMQLHHSPTIMPTSVCITAGPHVLEVVGVFIHILFVHINIVTPRHRLISSIAPSSRFEGCIFRRHDMMHFSFIYLLCDCSSCSTHRFWYQLEPSCFWSQWQWLECRASLHLVDRHLMLPTLPATSCSTPMLFMRSAPYSLSHIPVMALAQNHIHFLDVPGTASGSADIFIIHHSYLQLLAQACPILDGSAFPVPQVIILASLFEDCLSCLVEGVCWQCNFALGQAFFSHMFLSLSFWLSLFIPQLLIPNTEVCFVIVVHAVSYDYSTSVFLYRYLAH